MAQNSPTTAGRRLRAIHLVNLAINTHPAHQPGEHHYDSNDSGSGQQQIRCLQRSVIDERGRNPAAGHPANQAAGADEPVPGFTFMGRVNRVGKTPELLHQNNAQNINKNVKTGRCNRTGGCEQQTKNDQQYTNGQAGAEHHFNPAMAFDQPMIIGDKYSHSNSRSDPDVR